eukprot:CAMPEP_0119404900 /NCGR_PEP_ID=MMETSP1334-20130426/144129_1 /TAXON_ID=127549 /ORGANISM="Calcidiscus leptoporus, Strain RCC1130" /LENGTH=91 /DNA_ID=CAMNT_0007428871 /DNA_START=336 /DNA_END=611 /DNA_ORIENTATION=-
MISLLTEPKTITACSWASPSDKEPPRRLRMLGWPCCRPLSDRSDIDRSDIFVAPDKLLSADTPATSDGMRCMLGMHSIPLRPSTSAPLSSG